LESANPVPVPQKLKKAFPKPKNLKKKHKQLLKSHSPTLKEDFLANQSPKILKFAPRNEKKHLQ